MKKGQIFSVATPNLQIVDQQSQKDKYINNIQKQCIYIIENSDSFWTYYTEKTASIICYYECSFRYQKTCSYNLLSQSIVGLPGSRRKHLLDKTESFHCSSGCIPIRDVLKLKINKTKKNYLAVRWNYFQRHWIIKK